MDFQKASSMLRTKGWLAQTPKTFQKEVLSLCTLQFYAQGEVILRNGTEGDAIVGLVSGSLACRLPPRSECSSLIHLFPPGAWTGELAFFAGGVRRVDTVAHADSYCLRLTKTSMNKILDKNPGYWRWCNILTVMSCDVALHALEAVTALDGKSRVAKTLVRLVAINEQSCLLKTSQADIGAMCGLSRKAAHEVLKHFEQQGVLRRGHRNIEVLCHTKLLAIALGL
ncbi:Crp/Fnr family transcriptional regulator [Pseudomonas sp. RL_15y_Pfl2_60]|uniref:Crp/Fnr family transcriptional regulator n=1 Tax=Pseudomonas sp. RL_15y_Pfl2_60 TaxID=3088709 RepID=UPI0030D8391C